MPLNSIIFNLPWQLFAFGTGNALYPTYSFEKVLRSRPGKNHQLRFLVYTHVVVLSLQVGDYKLATKGTKGWEVFLQASYPRVGACVLT